MSDQPLLPQRVFPAAAAARAPRVEYVDFQDLDEHREYRFRIYGAEGSSEIRMRIANAAFDAGRVRMQDGPDVCYQKLLRAITAGETPGPGVIPIADGDLLSYRDEHVHVAKRRKRTPPPAQAGAPPDAPFLEPHRQTQYRPRTPRPASPRAAAPAPATIDAAPALEEGQRVNHAIFGVGVTAVTTRAHTVVRFDVDGPRTFVTSMVQLEVLSGPHTWETTARGVNRPCRTPAP